MTDKKETVAGTTERKCPKGCAFTTADPTDKFCGMCGKPLGVEINLNGKEIAQAVSFKRQVDR